MSARIPKGWAHLAPYGSIVKGTHFLPAKVPLDERYEQCYQTKEQRFEILEFIEKVEEESQRKVVAFMDFTNTDKYYQKEILMARAIRHIKFWGMQGHDMIPSETFVQKFIETTDELLKVADGIIIVHCTHGYNRTGFLICRYLQEVLKLSASEALQRFSEARGPGIYKAAYIDMLHWKESGGQEEFPNPADICYPPANGNYDDETRTRALVRNGIPVSVEELEECVKAFKLASLEQPHLLDNVIITHPLKAHSVPYGFERIPPDGPVFIPYNFQPHIYMPYREKMQWRWLPKKTRKKEKPKRGREDPQTRKARKIE